MSVRLGWEFFTLPSDQGTRPRMPSSRPDRLVVEPVSRHTVLLDVLSTLTDPRKRRGRRHTIAALVAVAVWAVLAGARGFTAIGQWAAESSRTTLQTLGMGRGPADEATFRRVFAHLDADLLDRVLGAWAATRVAVVDGLRVVCFDGKTVRGARKGTDRARTWSPHWPATTSSVRSGWTPSPTRPPRCRTC